MAAARRNSFCVFLLVFVLLLASTSLAAPIPPTKQPLGHVGAPPPKRAKGRLHANDRPPAGQQPSPNTSFKPLPSQQIFSHPDGKGGTVEHTGEQLNQASTAYLDVLRKDPFKQDKTQAYPKSGSGWREGDQDPSNPAPKASGQTAYHYPAQFKQKQAPGQSRVVAHGNPGQLLQLTPSFHDPAKPPNALGHTGPTPPQHDGFTPMALGDMFKGPLKENGSMRKRIVFLWGGMFSE